VADEFEYSAYCHCSDCRRTTGSAFKPFAGIRRNKFRLIRGDTDLLIYGEESGNDTHCKFCGALVFSVVRDGAYIHVPMGTLIDDPTIRPTKHIFVGSKASWFEIIEGQEIVFSARKSASCAIIVQMFLQSLKIG
jgi:hypothetical protein